MVVTELLQPLQLWQRQMRRSIRVENLTDVITTVTNATDLPQRAWSWMKSRQRGWQGRSKCRCPPPRDYWKQLWICRKHNLEVTNNPDGCRVNQTDSLHLTCFLWSLQPAGTSLLCPRSSWTTQTWSQGSSRSIQSSERWCRHRRRPQLFP